MRLYTFKGGIYPSEKKELSNSCKMEKAFPSTKTVVIPVTQGGAANKPLVSVGDIVSKGQIIADSDAFISAPVHASVPGKVTKIEPRIVTGNTEALCIVIEDDGSERTAYMEPLDPFKCSKEEAIARVRAAGICGMGGATFPTHVKLNPPADKKIDFVFANGAECEPYLTIDERIMQENTESVVYGLAACMKITNAPEGIIVLEDNKKHLVEILEKAVAKSGFSGIRVCLVKTKYPQGGEKMLVKAVVKREIPAGKLPADAGCIIQNVGTLAAIADAFRLGKPLIERGLTISGGQCEQPKNLLVPIGTLVGDLIPEVIQLKPGVCKILSGGPMMGDSMMTANFPVQKNTSGVLFLGKDELNLQQEDVCISCGRCIKACPCRLAPVMMIRSLNAGNLDEAVKYGLSDCIECGSCAYVCPGQIKLVQRIRIGKQQLKARAAAQKAQGGNN